MDSAINNLVGKLLTGGNLSAISHSVGANESTVSSAIGMAVPLIIGSMAHNSSRPSAS